VIGSLVSAVIESHCTPSSMLRSKSVIEVIMTSQKTRMHSQTSCIRTQDNLAAFIAFCLYTVASMIAATSIFITDVPLNTWDGKQFFIHKCFMQHIQFCVLNSQLCQYQNLSSQISLKRAFTLVYSDMDTFQRNFLFLPPPTPLKTNCPLCGQYAGIVIIFH